MSLLQLENVHTSYGSIKALQGISLSVEEGEVVTLIGANGAGKTTTLNTISGVTPAHQGRILFEGRDITRLSPHEIVELGIVQVPEGRKIFTRLTVRENLEMGAFTRRDPSQLKSDMDFVFYRFPRLKERINQLGGTLSGGEQQMLAIGRALMARPRLLLMDEPSMGLAPMLVREIFSFCAWLNLENGTPILLVEQNAHLALKVANRAYVLRSGRIYREGTAETLRNDAEIAAAYLGV